MNGEIPTAFFGKTWDEAFDLLHEARDYIAHEEPGDRAALPPGSCLAVSLESSRVTARLTQVMSWLMARRAVQEGEISPQTALSAPYRLEPRDSLANPDDDAEGGTELPPRLAALKQRSRKLYVRVARLDELIGRDPDPRSPFAPFYPPADPA